MREEEMVGEVVGPFHHKASAPISCPSREEGRARASLCKRRTIHIEVKADRLGKPRVPNIISFPDQHIAPVRLAPDSELRLDVSAATVNTLLDLMDSRRWAFMSRNKRHMADGQCEAHPR
jgi:hypothetical protein